MKAFVSSFTLAAISQAVEWQSSPAYSYGGLSPADTYSVGGYGYDDGYSNPVSHGLYDAGYGNSGYGGYGAGSYGGYGSQGPSYGAASYAAPGYGYGGYGASGYGNAGYGNAGYGNAGYGNAGYGNAGYGNAGYGAAGYGAGSYGAAGYGAGGYGGYGTVAHRAPIGARAYKPHAYQKDYGEWKKSYKLEVESFEQTVVKDTEHVWVVAFIDPACGYCKKLAVQWEKLKTVETIKVRKVKFGYVDITLEDSKKITQTYASGQKIAYTPTVLVYGRNKKAPSAYDGDYTTGSLNGFICGLCDSQGYGHGPVKVIGTSKVTKNSVKGDSDYERDLNQVSGYELRAALDKYGYSAPVDARKYGYSAPVAPKSPAPKAPAPKAPEPKAPAKDSYNYGGYGGYDNYGYNAPSYGGNNNYGSYGDYGYSAQAKAPAPKAPEPKAAPAPKAPEPKAPAKDSYNYSYQSPSYGGYDNYGYDKPSYGGYEADYGYNSKGY